MRFTHPPSYYDVNNLIRLETKKQILKMWQECLKLSNSNLENGVEINAEVKHSRKLDFQRNCTKASP